MLVPFVSALAVQTPTVLPKPMPPIVHVTLVGTKPRMKLRVVPNHKLKKHVVKPAAKLNPNA
jgi:hypothetical protein